ncbi:hypothetical protein G7K_1124-t1 [Saitoella complicata NRRL Y-17804]|uniref:Uncharacterized protein n=1 Tax=Saitoella complicata (strain BCRC 22490 / CBS 7301 / JCM 7358 / NBRC 10748 / NRRL Y-17804) TaxID=698492 RepID=A0A0E9NB40_SAICN|nr:hypothetical protein G7K_1124-t1 [Saitoella complicata NRRL Y-17804]
MAELLYSEPELHMGNRSREVLRSSSLSVHGGRNLIKAQILIHWLGGESRGPQSAPESLDIYDFPVTSKESNTLRDCNRFNSSPCSSTKSFKSAWERVQIRPKTRQQKASSFLVCAKIECKKRHAIVPKHLFEVLIVYVLKSGFLPFRRPCRI